MASATAHPVTPLSVDDVQRLRFRKAMSRKKRRDREAEGEIHELNLVAMMDLMTVILVFLLKSFSATTVAMSASEDIRPPVSTTRQTPKDTIAVTVTPKSILVGDKKILDLVKGELPANALNGRLVVKLDQELKKEVDKLRYIEARGGSPFGRELSVIGDRKIPYDLLLTVLYTAGQNELENYRFVVIQAEGKAPAE